MFNFMNLYKRIGIFGVKHYNLGKQFDYFQPYSIKMIYEIKISARFGQFLISS